MQLPPMQAGGHHIPEPLTCGLFRTTDRCCQHPTVYRMRVEGLLGLALGFLEPELVSQLFGLPAFPCVHLVSHLAQEPVEVLFADLHRAEGRIPLASCSWTGDGLHILHHHNRERQDRVQLRHDACLGLPAAPCGWGEPLFTVQTIVEALRSAPLAKPTSTSHRSARFDGLFDVFRRLDHQVRDGVPRSNHAEAFKRAPRINAYHERLIVRLLLVAELDVEQAKLVAFRFGFARLEQVTSFGGGTWHERYPAGIDNWYSQGISLLQVKPGLIRPFVTARRA